MLTDATEASRSHTVWDFTQQVASLAVALIAIWAGVVRLARSRGERNARPRLPPATRPAVPKSPPRSSASSNPSGTR